MAPLSPKLFNIGLIPQLLIVRRNDNLPGSQVLIGLANTIRQEADIRFITTGKEKKMIIIYR